MKKTVFLAMAVALISGNLFADCIDWPHLMTRQEIAGMPASKTSVLVEQFEDFTQKDGDSWLSFGLSRLLADYLSVGNGINAINGATAKHHPSAANPKYSVTGMFQHVGKNLRVFIKLSSGTELKNQFQIDAPYPASRQIFDAMADTAAKILSALGVSYDHDRLLRVQGATSSVPAFENYSKGVAAYQKYDPVQMDIAETWFNEAIRIDINYLPAYQGLVDVYTFLALYNKQNRKSYSGFLEKAEKTLLQMDRFSERPGVPTRPKRFVMKVEEKKFSVSNRFLLSNSAFVAGLSAAGQKKWQEAVRYFFDAVSLVPEDAITWSHLAAAREKAGDKRGANAATAKAKELNSCLK